MISTLDNDIIIGIGQFYLTKNPKEVLKAIRVSSSIVVTIFDFDMMLGGMAHMGLPDSRMTNTTADVPQKYVDVALPLFVEQLLLKGVSKTMAQVKIIGGSQLFNFGGGSGNLLNIGTRNAITTRTMLNRLGFQVEKTDTGGNKPRTIILEIDQGAVKVFHPGEAPRYI